jgi:hypothetical protein
LSEPKVLFFTPTLPARKEDPFLKPVRDRLSEIDTAGRFVAEVYRRVDQREMDLGQVYEDALRFATRERFDWLFAVEDDEAPPVDTLRMFLGAAMVNNGKLLTGTKRLRAASLKKEGMAYPWKWHFFEHGIHHVESVDQDPTGPNFQVFGGTFATPMLLSVPTLAFHGLHFHSFEQDHKNWDYLFSQDVYQAGLPFLVVPAVHAKHYCVDTHLIYE